MKRIDKMLQKKIFLAFLPLLFTSCFLTEEENPELRLFRAEYNTNLPPGANPQTIPS